MHGIGGFRFLRQLTDLSPAPCSAPCAKQTMSLFSNGSPVQNISPRSSEDPVMDCIIYKTTRLTDMVVRRRLQLYKDRLQTLHDSADRDKKTWMLDRGCKIEPDSAHDIQVQRRVIRPPRTWTVTATVTGQGQPIDLVGGPAQQLLVVTSATPAARCTACA